MDGWGGRWSAYNAVDKAHTPVIDELMANYPHCQLQASEDAVGLPKGQPGNSEVGHLTIGAGRLILQDLPRISAACASGEIDRLPPLVELIEKLTQTGGALHLTGLTSSGGVHAHMIIYRKLLAFLPQLTCRSGCISSQMGVTHCQRLPQMNYLLFCPACRQHATSPASQAAILPWIGIIDGTGRRPFWM